jgi:ATP-dependent Clp protease ATP-binding subunit ClpA
MAKAAIGFGREQREGEDQEAIQRMFTPEFRNRLDSIIAFAGLTPEVVSRVVDKFIIQLETQLGDRDVTILLSDEARRWLAEKGYDKNYGARPLARVIQEHIKKSLAEELLFGRLSKGGIVKVDVDADDKTKLSFTFEEGGSKTVKEPEMVE